MRYAIALLAILAASPAGAQVGITPQVTTPAAWERYGVRVINQTDTATVLVQVEVPAVILVLGVEPKPGWIVRTIPATDSSGLVIEWSGGSLTRGQYAEFAFLGRLDANAKQEDLGLPVRIQRANGSEVTWRRPRGEPYAAPRVDIVGTVGLSSAGQIALAAAAIGLSILAIIIAVALGTSRRG